MFKKLVLYEWRQEHSEENPLYIYIILNYDTFVGLSNKKFIKEKKTTIKS